MEHFSSLRFAWIALCIVLSSVLRAQDITWPWYDQTFDDTLRYNLSIDTTDGHGGLWQIGTPQKTVFIDALSPPNVIVTDTLLPYPPNDTSRFTITNLAQDGWLMPHTVILSGYYWADIDTGDFGMIEISFDQGNTWSDLLNDPVLLSYMSSMPAAPVLTGSTIGWQFFHMDVAQLHNYAWNELGIAIDWNDSIQYRFSFISDSVDDAHDGLMYDDLHFEDWSEAIPEFQASTFHSEVIPDPVDDQLSVVYETVGVSAPTLIVRNAQGIRCLERTQLAEHRAIVDVSALGPGIYFYELRAANHMRSFGRFLKAD
jgi:hypothetical protein